MGSHEYFQDLVSMYALGALPTAEAQAVKQHLAGCDECRNRYVAERALVQMMPRAIESVEPSRETKQKLFARVDADLAQDKARMPEPKRTVVQEKPRRSWFAQPVFAFAVIALVAVLAVGGWLWFSNRQTPEQQRIAAILNDPNVQRVSLQGTPDAPNALAEMYMVPGHSQAVLQVRGLDPLPQDKGYEFWFFRDGQPQPSNVFVVNPDGSKTVLVEANDTVENFKGWGVTIEPRAGVPAPTGPIVILGGL
jgi:anti-sigma-K factor RskA